MRTMLLALAVAGCAGSGSDCEEVTWFVDADGDTYGAVEAVMGCVEERPADAVNRPGDCADDDATINPAATERCNGVDDDCDGLTDDADPDVDPSTQSAYYTDEDGDGFGTNESEVLACAQPKNGVLDGGDCNDRNEDINPAAEETCFDLEDVNCDGVAPDDDADGDGALACEDCDEADDTVGAAPLWYRDRDGDGFGTNQGAIAACTQPKGHVPDGDDCDDKTLAINPGADERCDEIDNDCDKAIDDEDDSLTGAPRWYSDADGDSFGDAERFVEQCTPIVGAVTNGADCDDTNKDIGLPTLWYDDADDDTYGDENGAATSSCDQPKGTVANNEDCDDGDESINPDTVWYNDSDDDGFGDDGDTLAQCDQPTDYVADDTDCDDTTHLVHPGRFDFADKEDNDCDDLVDEDVGSEQYDSTDIQSIVDAECKNCHTNGGSNGGLNMDDLYDDTVGVASSDVATMSLFEPGDLRNSYIWHKLQGTQSDVGGAGAQMPSGGSLTKGDEETIETWILEGAIE